jgi:hypothetical protein
MLLQIDGLGAQKVALQELLGSTRSGEDRSRTEQNSVPMFRGGRPLKKGAVQGSRVTGKLREIWVAILAAVRMARLGFSFPPGGISPG